MTRPYPKLANFRDIGGQGSDDGRRVKQGHLFRGTALFNATDDDLEAMAGLGIGLVFDLRSRPEVFGRPDRLPPSASYLHVPAVPSMDVIRHELLDWDALMDQLSSSEEMLVESETFQAGVYTEMMREPLAFKTLVGELLRDPARPVYIHCSAGKDRTGMACATVLTLLGVPRDAILDDYLESARHPSPDMAGVLEKAAQYGPRVQRLVKLMLGVTVAQFDKAFAEADRVWGGWDGFVRDGLGLTPNDVIELREAYLEPAV